MAYPQAASSPLQALHGKYYPQTRAGQTFVFTSNVNLNQMNSVQAGSCVFALWNPAGSGVNAFIVSYRFGIQAAVASSTTGLAWTYVYAGSSIPPVAGSTPCSFNPVYPPSTGINLLVGNGVGSKSQVFQDGVAYSSASVVPTSYIVTGIGMISTATVPDTAFYSGEDYDGTLMAGPGWLLAANANIGLGTTWATNALSIKWYEAPVLG